MNKSNILINKINEIKSVEKTYLHRDEVSKHTTTNSTDYSIGWWNKRKAAQLAKKHGGEVHQTLIPGKHKVVFK